MTGRRTTCDGRPSSSLHQELRKTRKNQQGSFGQNDRNGSCLVLRWFLMAQGWLPSTLRIYYWAPLYAITSQRRAPALALQGVELCVEGGDAGAAALSQGDHAEDRTVGGDGGVRRAQQAGQQRVRDRALARLEVRAETLISRDIESIEMTIFVCFCLWVRERESRHCHSQSSVREFNNKTSQPGLQQVGGRFPKDSLGAFRSFLKSE